MLSLQGVVLKNQPWVCALSPAHQDRRSQAVFPSLRSLPGGRELADSQASVIRRSYSSSRRATVRGLYIAGGLTAPYHVCVRDKLGTSNAIFA